MRQVSSNKLVPSNLISAFLRASVSSGLSGFIKGRSILNQQVIRWGMEASVSENITAARQQKTDANYLPMAARKQNILWHLLCLSRMAADAKEI